MKIKVDWKLCEGNGACTVAAPKHFEIGDDDNLIVHDENPPEADRPALEAAVQSCPRHALSIED